MKEKVLLVGRWAGTGLAVFCVLAFIVQNMQSVETRFLMFSITAPRAALIAISFALGIVTGVLLMLKHKKRTPAGP